MGELLAKLVILVKYYSLTQILDAVSKSTAKFAFPVIRTGGCVSFKFIVLQL